MVAKLNRIIVKSTNHNLSMWPVHNRVAEAYVFYAMLSKQPAGWERRGAELLCPIGGFTQNDTKLSPLASLVYEQARRQVQSYQSNAALFTKKFSATTPLPPSLLPYFPPSLLPSFSPSLILSFLAALPPSLRQCSRFASKMFEIRIGNV